MTGFGRIFGIVVVAAIALVAMLAVLGVVSWSDLWSSAPKLLALIVIVLVAGFAIQLIGGGSKPTK